MSQQKPPTTGPGSFRAQSPQSFRDLSDAANWQQRAFTAHSTLDATAVKGPTTGGGFAVNSGSSTVTGSLLGITSGLSTVDHVVVSLDNGSTPTNAVPTATVNSTDSSKIDIFVWRPTSAGDNTPVPTTSPHVVKWWVTGLQTT